MWTSLAKGVSNLSVVQLKMFRICQILLFLFSIFLFIVFCFKIPHQPVLFLLFLLVFGLQHGLKILFVTGQVSILTQNLDLNKYQETMETCHNFKIFPFYQHNEFVRSDYYLKLSLIYFYRGQFKQALEYLDQIEDVHRFRGDMWALKFSMYYQIYALSKLFSGQDYDFDTVMTYLMVLRPKQKVIKQIIDERIATIKSLQDVVKNKKYSEFLDHLSPDNELEKIIFGYYQALNAQVSGNEEKAWRNYLTLSKLDDDFYYVREAKRYIEENKYVR